MRRKKKKSWRGCGCPRGSRRISTRGVARGWVCQSKKPRKTRGRLRNVGRYFYPFVKATCR
jgi:hypothetical protein